MGFQLGLAARWGVEPGQVETISLPTDPERAGELLRGRLRAGPAPDGIFALADGLLRSLVDFGRRAWPEGGRLNTCCFDNFLKAADLFDIPCLEQDLVGIGVEAARIISALRTSPGAPVKNVRLPPRWVEGRKDLG